MGKIFCIMGKSASGKDTIYKRLLAYFQDELSTIVSYTTRPIREGEQDGVEYFFITEQEVTKLKNQGRVIELREYQTVSGPWKYLTVDDGQIDLKKHSYLIIGTLESYVSMKSYMGEASLVPIYISLDDKERMRRAMERESKQKNPNYEEIHRRFQADNLDFSGEKLKQAGIDHCFYNHNLEDTVQQIILYMKEARGAFCGSYQNQPTSEYTSGQ